VPFPRTVGPLSETESPPNNAWEKRSFSLRGRGLGATDSTTMSPDTEVPALTPLPTDRSTSPDPLIRGLASDPGALDAAAALTFTSEPRLLLEVEGGTAGTVGGVNFVFRLHITPPALGPTTPASAS